MDDKFEIISNTLKKSFYNKINLRNKIIETNVDTFNKEASNEMNLKCASYFEKLLEVSQQSFKQETSTLTITSKTGFEKEYNDITKDIINCVMPFKVLLDKISTLKTIYSKLSSLSYDNCIDECKIEYNDKHSFKFLKNCLKDCLKLNLDNFNSYDILVDNTLKYCELNLKI